MPSRKKEEGESGRGKRERKGRKVGKVLRKFINLL
jgi:hypothetical protein